METPTSSASSPGAPSSRCRRAMPRHPRNPRQPPGRRADLRPHQSQTSNSTDSSARERRRTPSDTGGQQSDPGPATWSPATSRRRHGAEPSHDPDDASETRPNRQQFPASIPPGYTRLRETREQVKALGSREIEGCSRSYCSLTTTRVASATRITDVQQQRLLFASPESLFRGSDLYAIYCHL